jgi:hypothetical protein
MQRGTMSNLSTAVQVLEDRRAALEAELEKVNQSLQSIQAALGSSPAASKVKVSKSAEVKESKRAAKSSGKKSTTRRWFQPGEAVSLMQKMLTKPTRPGDVIKQLGAAKGYIGKLSSSEMERFTWAATSALKAAIKARKLLKLADGAVKAATGK